MPYTSRLVIAMSIFILSLSPSTGQLVSFVDTEVRSVEEDRVVLPGGEELLVAMDEDENYGPQLENYPMLKMVGYINLARLHVVQGVVIQVDVLDMQQ